MKVLVNPFDGSLGFSQKQEKPLEVMVGNEPIPPFRLVGIRQGRLFLAESNASNNTPCIGFVNKGYAQNSKATVMTSGVMELDYSIQSAELLFLDTTPGRISRTPVFGRLQITQQIGYWLSPTSVFIKLEVPIFNA